MVASRSAWAALPSAAPFLAVPINSVVNDVMKVH